MNIHVVEKDVYNYASGYIELNEFCLENYDAMIAETVEFDHNDSHVLIGCLMDYKMKKRGDLQ